MDARGSRERGDENGEKYDGERSEETMAGGERKGKRRGKRERVDDRREVAEMIEGRKGRRG
jgi:hypothetical protein